VVELECTWVPVVTADNAPSAGLGNEDLFHPPPSLGNPIRAALRAAVIALNVKDEPRRAVDLAVALHLDKPGLPRCSSGLCRERRPRFETPAAEPITNRRLTTPKRIRDLALRVPKRYQSFERCPVHEVNLSSQADGEPERLFG